METALTADKFGWKDSYKIGNAKIDGEHEKLFDIAQKAFKIKKNEALNKEVKAIILQLYDYMQTHFKAEERFMASIQYPWMEEQKELHSYILSEVNRLLKELPNMGIELFSEELSELIRVRFLQHIIQEDQKIINWVDKKK